MPQKNPDRSVLQTLQTSMGKQIARQVAATADWPTPIDGLMFFRRDCPTEPEYCLIEPSVVLVVQGAKQIVIGGDSYPYTTENFLITSLDLPATSQVLVASSDTPCLGLALRIDVQMLADLVAQGAAAVPRERQSEAASVGLGEITSAMLEPFARLVTLLDEPQAIAALSPLILREIHYRLLQSDQASLLRLVASVDSQSYRIAKAVDWLKLNYRNALRIDDLAAQVQMSTPSFHHHFRQLTSMSPLKYQKWLRLNEAKRLMLNEHVDASSAGYQVGYESPSQFSREYSRLFGAPPKKNIDALRRQAAGA